jgi:hypothetical protein
VRREKTRRAGSSTGQALNGVLSGRPGVRSRFMRTVVDWLAVNEYPVGGENDQLLIRIALAKFLGSRVEPVALV